MKKYFLFTLSFVLSGIIGVYAGGFQLNLQGLRQMSMGGSGVAMPWDASAIFYNPGAFARLHHLEVNGNIFLSSPHVKYLQTPTGGYSYDNQTQYRTPFSFYAGGNLGHESKLAVGVGVYTPFGNSLKWDDNWTGRYLVQSISLESIFIQPTISYELDDVISVGAGFVYAVGKVDIDKAIPVQDMYGSEGSAQLSGNAQGIGFNVGVHIKPSKMVDIGLSYRSGVKMKVNDGDAEFSVAKSVMANFPNTNFSSELPLPGILTGGVAIKPSTALTLQADLVLAFWHSYDSLKFDFVNNTDALQDTHDPRKYRNTLAFRAGANYAATDWLDVMVGGAYDPTPSRTNLVSPDAVDADRINLSCGLSVKPADGLSISAGVNYTTTAKRETSYDPAGFYGAYKINSLIPALGVSFSF